MISRRPHFTWQRDAVVAQRAAHTSDLPSQVFPGRSNNSLNDKRFRIDIRVENGYEEGCTRGAKFSLAKYRPRSWVNCGPGTTIPGPSRFYPLYLQLSPPLSRLSVVLSPGASAPPHPYRILKGSPRKSRETATNSLFSPFNIGPKLTTPLGSIPRENPVMKYCPVARTLP